jgi:hypothetical protein
MLSPQLDRLRLPSCRSSNAEREVGDLPSIIRPISTAPGLMVALAAFSDISSDEMIRQNKERNSNNARYGKDALQKCFYILK